MPSTANPVVTVEEALMLSKGKSPVRINQRPSKSIPRFLPAKLLVNVMLFSLWMLLDARNEAAYITRRDSLGIVRLLGLLCNVHLLPATGRNIELQGGRVA